MARLFVFDHLWRVPADPEVAYAALADVEGYPRWWPEIKVVRRIDEDCGEAEVRSVLPYTLCLVLTRALEDPSQRRLRVAIEGDLAGWAAFELAPDAAAGTLARYRQEVRVTARYLSHASPLAEPLLRFNHGWMMRSGERGLAAYLRRSAGP